MKKNHSNRVLARRLAHDLSIPEWTSIDGQGTSFTGSGHRYPDGRYDDVNASDCCEGPDIFISNPV